MMVAARVKPSTTTPTQRSLTSRRVEAMWARPWMVEELRNSLTEVISPDILGGEQTGDYCERRAIISRDGRLLRGWTHECK